MTKEEIYDAQINPLMTQIIAVCRENRITVIATFHIDTPDDPNLTCSTSMVGVDAPALFHVIHDLILLTLGK